MTEARLIDFLLNRRGYLKEGAARLSRKLNIDEDICREALREARLIVNQEEESSNSNLVLKARWQNAGGEWLESYKAVSDEDTTKELKELKASLISDLKSLAKADKKVNEVEDIATSYALEVNLPDFHFGKLDGSSIEEQASLYVNSIKEIINKTSSYSISRIILPIGNDVLNSEGMRKSTTRGTPQEDNADWKDTFRVAWLSIVESINLLVEIAPVQVVTVLGNHDFERSFYLGELLSALYSLNENVDVINNGEERNYIVFGKNLLGYTHGDKIKPQDLPLIMATEVPVEFAGSAARSWRLGHLHKHMQDEYRGIEVEFLPALCGSDEWHKAMGYHSDRKAMAYLWDYEGGKAGFVQINKR